MRPSPRACVAFLLDSSLLGPAAEGYEVSKRLELQRTCADLLTRGSSGANDVIVINDVRAAPRCARVVLVLEALNGNVVNV